MRRIVCLRQAYDKSTELAGPSRPFSSRNSRSFSRLSLPNNRPEERPIIEKFEHYARNVDVVFVLATPDDFGRLAMPRQSQKSRARQNVVFELGFFLGSLKRRSGRVILVHKGGLELPSDISGVVYVDITTGLDAAEAEIRRELAPWTD